jgi:hypothetical protein
VDHFETPQARCRAAAARRDITPPVGIYHRMWGAATHDRATGVHRPLFVTALAFESWDDASLGRQVIVTIDHCLLWADDMQRLRAAVCQWTGLEQWELHIAFSHTHGAGLMDRTRAASPGGELIGPYLDRIEATIGEAVREALESLAPASIVYGAGRCDLAAHRDQWDSFSGQFVCGFHPEGPTDDTVLVVRVSSPNGKTIATVVNYACHPTTLAWENTLISPDYVGAMRETVERAIGGLCLFLQGASGDLGPREGYLGDSAVADRNGRQLGFAALSALEALPPAAFRLEYAGPVVSGATLGTWRQSPLSADALQEKACWRRRDWSIDLPYRTELPTLAQSQADMARWIKAEHAAHDEATKRDCRAHVERLQRQITRLNQLPAGPVFPLPISLWRIGDGYWLMLEGEYYHHLQRALRDRIGPAPMVIATVVDGWRPAYLPTRETYGRGIYQEQVAVLAPGCLEAVIDAVSAQIETLASQCRDQRIMKVGKGIIDD